MTNVSAEQILQQAEGVVGEITAARLSCSITRDCAEKLQQRVQAKLTPYMHSEDPAVHSVVDVQTINPSEAAMTMVLYLDNSKGARTLSNIRRNAEPRQATVFYLD